MSELWQLGVSGLSQLFVSRAASPVEALEACLQRIDAADSEILAFSAVLADAARSEATARTDELRRGIVRSPLHGVPVAVKELFDVEGGPGDYGSDVLAGEVAAADAELVRRLRRAGAVIVGTTRSHEFGWGITTQHRSRPSTRNPWDHDRVPGGSSGGSGAAVAVGMVPLAIGSDTGGSIRIPASFCGVAGLKPTYGRVPRTGGVPLAPSLDTPGALARTIGDAAVAVGAISGPDGLDPACSLVEWRSAPAPRPSLHGTRIGVSEDLFERKLDAAIAGVYESGVEALAELGAELVDVELPPAADMRSAFVPFQMAEAFHVHNRMLGLYPEHADRYGPDVRSRLDAASEVTIGDYLEAAAARDRLNAAFDAGLRSVDAVVSAVSAVAPPRRENCDEVSLHGEVVSLRDAVMGFTTPQNMTGLPTSVVPVGFDDAGLPVGLQLTCARWREDRAAAVAGALQLVTGSTGKEP